jgi:hypothetical protein
MASRGATAPARRGGTCPPGSSRGRRYEKHHNRWSADGTWQQLVTAAQAHADAVGDLDWLIAVNSTIMRAHQHATGARRDTNDQSSRGWVESHDHAA